MTPAKTPRIAVLGGGPIALEATLYASTLGYPVTLLERGRVGNHLRHWGHLKLFTPWSMNTSLLGRRRLEETGRPLLDPDGIPTGLELLEAYLLPLSQLPEFESVIQEHARVLAVTRAGVPKGADPGSASRTRGPFKLLVERDGVQSHLYAEVLLDATGVYGSPAPLGADGIPAPGEAQAATRIRVGLPPLEPGSVDNLDVLVVGSGMSAATTLAALAQARPASVTWVTLGGGIPEVPGDPLAERVRLTRAANAFGHSGQVDHRAGYGVQNLEVDGNRVRVTLTSLGSGETEIREVDTIFNHTGFRPDLELLRELQIHLCYASEGTMNLAAALLGADAADCLDQTGHGADTLRNPEPNCFVIGHKSYGRNGNFLLRVGHEQVRDVFQLITGNAALDLYSAPAVSTP